ncbi:MAG TPA: hypothetical protein VLG36_05895 [Candidatus Chromulinivoraceae bacterium]|nr:hypothetical protein [Candidatus Chromulinivoraceae bacterium]
MSEDRTKKTAAEVNDGAPAGTPESEEVMTELPPEFQEALRKAFSDGLPSRRTRIIAGTVAALSAVGAVVTVVASGKFAVKAVRRVRRH